MLARLAWRKQSRSEALSFRQSTSTSIISGYGQTNKGSSELSHRDDIRLNSTECSQTSPWYRKLPFLFVVFRSSEERLMGLRTYITRLACILAQAFVTLKPLIFKWNPLSCPKKKKISSRFQNRITSFWSGNASFHWIFKMRFSRNEFLMNFY